MKITSLALLSVINAYVYAVSAAEESDTQSVWNTPVKKKQRALNAWNDWSKPTKQPVSAWNGKWSWDGSNWNWSWEDSGWGPKPTKKPTSWDSSWSGKGPSSWVVNSGGDDAWAGNGWFGNGWGPKKPTDLPTQTPSSGPSEIPSENPSDVPSSSPSLKPSDEPSFKPSSSMKPSEEPSALPSVVPSTNPTISIEPTISMNPSLKPSISTNPSISMMPSYDCTFIPEGDCQLQTNRNVIFFNDATCYASGPCGAEVIEDFVTEVPIEILNVCHNPLSAGNFEPCFLPDELTEGWSFYSTTPDGVNRPDAVASFGPNSPLPYPYAIGSNYFKGSGTFQFESDTISAVGFDVFSFFRVQMSIDVLAVDDSVLGTYSLPSNGSFFGVVSQPGVYIKKVVVNSGYAFAVPACSNLRFGPVSGITATVQDSTRPNDPSSSSNKPAIDFDSIDFDSFPTELSSFSEFLEEIEKNAQDDKN